jgi:hypothetical protein
MASKCGVRPSVGGQERTKAITWPGHRLPEPIEPIVAEVNRVLRGWGAYFRMGNATRQFHHFEFLTALLTTTSIRN